MVKANELRIGNIVIANHDINELIKKGALVEITTISDKDDPVSDYNPIQITTEWLEKFGFVGYNNDGIDLTLKTKSLVINYSDDEICIWFNEYPTMGALRMSHIQYVHQLQNLYFALTGEELELKK